MLIVLRRPSLVRYYDSTLALLARRGHDLELVFSELVGKGGAPPDLDRTLALLEAFPERISYGAAPAIDPRDGWRGIAGAVRICGDFMRYVHPRFAEAPLLRRRQADRVRSLAGRVPPPLRGAARRLVDRLERTESARLSNVAAWLGRRLEEALPPAREVLELVAERRPDVVVVAPLVDPGTDQVEFVKAARALEIPSAGAIPSWDNLSSKGLIRLDPDRIFVWNDVQVREAVEMHGVDGERIVATGAPRFDPWFGREPSRTGDELAAQVGLSANEPYILYLCSSAFIAPNELPFVERWLTALREDAELGRVGVLVRPHPQNAHVWKTADLSRFTNAVVWPRSGANVDDESSRADFFDSLVHSVAVVGINTSALIEAAIAGKNVFTIVDENFAQTQLGTLHYHYLRHENGGFLHEATRLDAHLDQLRESLRDTSAAGERTRAFVAAFIRPRGADQDATTILADEIERVASTRPSPLPTRTLRLPLTALAAMRRRKRARTGRADGSGTVVA